MEETVGAAAFRLPPASAFARLQRDAWEHPVRFNVAVFALAKLGMLVAAWWLVGEPRDFLLQLSTAWDGQHYLDIARGGYALNTYPDLPNPLAFAPAFPFLVKLTGATDLSPLLVANAAGFGAVAGVTRLMGLRAGLFFALFPTWIAYSTVGYSEALFVFLAAWALVSFRERRYEWAGALSGVAVTTRYSGAVAFATLMFPLARVRDRRAWAAYLLPALFAGGVLLALLRLYGGTFDAYFAAERQWGGLATPWAQADWILHGWFTNQGGASAIHPSYWLLRNGAFAAVTGFGVAHLVRRDRDTTLASFSLVVLVLSLCTTGLPAISAPRILLMGFPAVAAVGRTLRGASTWAAVAALELLLGTWVLTAHLTGFFA